MGQTVKDLQALLADLPPDAIVVVDGYETGFDPLDTVELVAVVEGQHDKYYEGLYMPVKEGGEQAVLLRSKRRFNER